LTAESQELNFFKDLDRYAPVEFKYAGGAMLATSYVMMAYFRFKKF
jgi:hypothetical protein